MIRDTILVYEDYKDDLVLLDSVRKGESYNDYLLRQAKIHMGVEELPTIPINLTSLVHALVDNGRWMWQCVACNIGVIVDMRKMSSTASPSLCPNCLYQGWIKVVVPKNRQEIDDELLKQPGFRLKTAFRNWEPSWDMDYLVRRTGRAREKVESGVPNPRSASIGATRLWSVGEILTASNKNTFERGPIRDLAGRNGPIGPYESSIILFNATTAQRNALAEESGMMLYNSTTKSFEGYEGTNWGPFLRGWVDSNSYIGGGDAVATYTINHPLGKVPLGHQLRLVNSGSGTTAGMTAGEHIDVGAINHGGSGFLYSVYDKSSTSVKLGIRFDTDNNGNANLSFVSGNGSFQNNHSILQSNSWTSALRFRLALYG